jgi:hypothetical protein
MSTRPRVPAAIPGAPADFGSVMSHVPDTLAGFFELYAEFWQHGIVPVELKEMTRLRNARVTDCGF